MAYTDRAPIIIPDGAKNNADAVFSILDPDSGGAASFSSPVALLGNPLLRVGWASYSQMEQETFDALTGLSNNAFLSYVNALATERGRLAVGSVLQFKNAAIVGVPGEGFWEFLTTKDYVVVETLL